MASYLRIPYDEDNFEVETVYYMLTLSIKIADNLQEMDP